MVPAEDLPDEQHQPSSLSDELVEYLQREIGELAMIYDGVEWVIFTPWGSVRDCTLETAMWRTYQQHEERKKKDS